MQVYRFDMTTRWPDLAALEVFVAVARTGSLSAAARSVGMAQPNATRAIARLEHDLGVSLLVRRTSGSSLTEAGQTLLEGAVDIIGASRSWLRDAGDLGEEGRAHLAVGASLTVAEYLMPGWLAALKREHPQLLVGLVVENSRRIFEELANDVIDVGFVESPNIPKGLRRLAVSTDHLSVVVAPGHAWANRAFPLSASELAAEALVVRERGSGTRTVLERALHGHAQLAPALELGSNAAVRLAVEAGAGAAVLSDFVIRAQVDRGELVEVAVAGISLARRIRAVWKGPRVLSGPAGDLVARARQGYGPGRASNAGLGSSH
ncbi:LysR family transcriptional regulator [Arthrobacter cryoconiti]